MCPWKLACILRKDLAHGFLTIRSGTCMLVILSSMFAQICCFCSNATKEEAGTSWAAYLAWSAGNQLKMWHCRTSQCRVRHSLADISVDVHYIWSHQLCACVSLCWCVTCAICSVGSWAIPREQVHHSQKFQLTFEDFGIISHLVACL